MSDPSSKADLIEAMVSARGRFDSLISQIPHSKMTLPGASGEWSVKDVVAHITSYDRWLALTLALRGQKPPDFWIEDIPLDEFNRRLFDENRDLSLDQVLQQSGDVWREILEVTRNLPETYLFTEQSVQGVPYTFKPCDVLKSESYGHYLDHVPALLAWIEAIN
ncbi:MAG: hypothetical protein A2Z14_08590 [Chloroflexi bacterium RBG_16_48_8]|nr:MAG: hypothetical protein A2Z14_08590 [Chloroflexi bacterium RBG_16_48_8]